MSFAGAPLTYRPELPLRWYERVMVALGIRVRRRRGEPVPVVADRDYLAGSVMYLDISQHGFRIVKDGFK